MNVTTWSGDELEEEPPTEENEISGNFVTFTTCIDGTKSEPTVRIDQCEDDKLTYENLEESYV